MNNKFSKISKLRGLIGKYFNVGELKSLCFDIDINYDELPGENLSIKVQELVSYCYRHNRTEELIAVCKQLRPHGTWILEDQYDDIYLPDNKITSSLFDRGLAVISATSLSNRLASCACVR
jgi:hypothetical protein